jgi:nucleotide-binding universal stress UspA family protein
MAVHAYQTIVHVSDLTEHDAHAFELAVVLAASFDARLVTLHAARTGEPSRPMPSPTEVTARIGWPKGPAAYEGIRHVCCDDPVDTTLDALRMLEPDLIVLGTSQKQGVQRFLAGSVSEAVLRNCTAPTIVVPHGAGNLLNADHDIALRRVVLPAGDAACLEASAHAFCSLLYGLMIPETPMGVVLHFGDGAAPELVEPCEGVQWQLEHHPGKTVDGVLTFLQERGADLVVMATRGHDSFLDAVRGTHTERVLRHASCPMLIVPMAGQ